MALAQPAVEKKGPFIFTLRANVSVGVIVEVRHKQNNNEHFQIGGYQES